MRFVRAVPVVVAVLLSCRPGDQARPTAPAPAPAVDSEPLPAPHPLPLFHPSPEEMSEITSFLRRRHSTEVEITESFGVEAGGERRVFVAYQYQSLDSWRTYRVASQWSEGGGGPPDPPELEARVWQAGLERCGLGDPYFDRLEERVPECMADTGDREQACSANLAESLFEEIGYSSCSHDRVAVAALVMAISEGDPDGVGAGDVYIASVATHVLEGQRCEPLSFFVPAELDGSAPPEVLLEVTWHELACGENAADRQMLDLVVFGADLSVQLDERLFTRDMAAGEAPRPEAAYWPEPGEGGEVPARLVVERLTVPAGCSMPPCAHLSLSSVPEDEALEERARQLDPRFNYITRSCFPAGTEPDPSCRPLTTERSELTFDASAGRWSPVAGSEPDLGSE